MVSDNIDRAYSLLNTELTGLRTLSRDWAWWDDTFKFAQDKNQEYLESNLSGLTLEQLDLDFF